LPDAARPAATLAGTAVAGTALAGTALAGTTLAGTTLAGTTCPGTPLGSPLCLRGGAALRRVTRPQLRRRGGALAFQPALPVAASSRPRLS